MINNKYIRRLIISVLSVVAIALCLLIYQSKDKQRESDVQFGDLVYINASSHHAAEKICNCKLTLTTQTIMVRIKDGHTNQVEGKPTTGKICGLMVTASKITRLRHSSSVVRHTGYPFHSDNCDDLKDIRAIFTLDIAETTAGYAPVLL